MQEEKKGEWLPNDKMAKAIGKAVGAPPESYEDYQDNESVLEPEFKIIKGEEILSKEVKKFPYIVDKLVPEKAITSITADSGRGKSIVSLIIAKAIASGEKLFDEFEVKKSKVLILDQEMDEDLIVGRYKAIIQDKLDIDYIYEQFLLVDKEEDYNWLKQTIIDNDYGVLVLDTLTNVHSGEENSAKEMRELNKLLLKLIIDTGVTIVYLHHHRKRLQGERFNQASSRGSTEIIAKVASHLLIDSKHRIDDDDNYVTELTISQEKARRPEAITKIGVNIIYNPETRKTTWDYQGVVDSESKTNEAKELIVKMFEFSGGESTMDDIVTNIPDIGMTNLRSAIKELIREKVIDFHKGQGRQHNTKFYFLLEE